MASVGLVAETTVTATLALLTTIIIPMEIVVNTRLLVALGTDQMAMFFTVLIAVV
jgi:hypothetical protein